MNTSGRVSALLALLAFTLSGCGRDKDNVHEAPKHLGGTPTGTPALSVQDSVMPAAPDREMRRARTEIGSDAHSAAENVREAASIVRAEATDATRESHDMLDRSARSLDELASAIESGAVRAERDLDREFIHVHRALATDRITRARAQMEKNEARSAGEHLREAADHLESALGYAKQEAEKGGEDVVRNARRWMPMVVSADSVRAMVCGHDDTRYADDSASDGSSNDASLEKTPTFSSGLNWYATSGAFDTT